MSTDDPTPLKMAFAGRLPVSMGRPDRFLVDVVGEESECIRDLGAHIEDIFDTDHLNAASKMPNGLVLWEGHAEWTHDELCLHGEFRSATIVEAACLVTVGTVWPDIPTRTPHVARIAPAAALAIPIADDVDGTNMLRAGFRQIMLEIETDDIKGSVASGAGYGSPFIALTWGNRQAVVSGCDLLAAWVSTFDPESGAGLARFFEGLDRAEDEVLVEAATETDE